MEVTVYIEMEGYSDGDFDVSENYYKSDDDYFAAMHIENEKNKNVAYDFVSNMGQNNGKKTATFSVSPKEYKRGKSIKYKAFAELFNDENKPEDVDNLIKNYVSQDVVVNIFKFKEDGMDEEFEEDLNFWVSDHNTINKMADKLGEEAVWKNEPLRTFIVEFKNNAGEIKYMQYNNCRLLDASNDGAYAIIADNLTLNENF